MSSFNEISNTDSLRSDAAMTLLGTGELPRSVRLVEVGPRDGLQNEPTLVATEVKVELIGRLADCGLTTIEATAFVSPTWVPQMADAAAVMSGIERRADVRYPVLVPNLKGLEAALAAGATDIAVFAAASETFSQRNINCSITESLRRFEPVMAAAQLAGVRVRGYVSCVLGCPYEGAVAPAVVAAVASALYGLGCEEISLGDTIGVGTPVATQAMIEAVARQVPIERLAGHYHDTYGMAVANIYASLQVGMAIFDASVAGLGGCPYAKGASGNVASEEVVWLLRGLGIECGIDLERLLDVSEWLSQRLQRPPASRVARALLARRQQAG
jgi:hydroxymethylglutaryl-CoA lyase